MAQQRQGLSGPRLNRYYEKLRPYYRVNQDIKENEGPTNEQSDVPEQLNPNALPADKTLVFESRFESGNLRKVLKVGTFEYELYLKNDYGTQSFCQWYYFRI